MNPATLESASAHALADYPRESCGLVSVVKGRERYTACRNIAENAAAHFVVDPEDYDAAESLGEITSIVHSHPDVSAMPSEADLVMCEATGLPWHIIAVHGDEEAPRIVATHVFEPTGYVAPLVGRSFHHGVLDCFTLVKDWYERERGIVLPDFNRPDDWWNKGANLYMENFAAAGFREVGGAVEVGDLFLMQVRSPVPNHAAIYLGDGLILHHLFGRLSSRDVYGGQWAEMTRTRVRYG